MAKFYVEVLDITPQWVVVEAATKEEALKTFEEGEEGDGWEWDDEAMMQGCWEPTGKVVQK
jgi:hypothetical protein